VTLGVNMPRFARFVIGWASAAIAGVSTFFLFLIVTGIGPGLPRLPEATVAKVLFVYRELVGAEAPHYRYVATVQWTNEQAAVIRQRDAWGRDDPDLSEGQMVQVVIFRRTGDPKHRTSSSPSVGIGSMRDYWWRQGPQDWGLFWLPILAVLPATYAAYIVFRSRRAAPSEDAA
jgi:hypothetical protein